MEKALRYELEQAIPELAGNIYPTNAPEAAEKPYLVYYRQNTDHVKTLEGYTDKQGLTYLYSVMAAKYGDMKILRDKIEAFLLALPGQDIGEDGIHIEDVDINNINETYEFNLRMNRGIIDFTVFF
mgnify:CR=1 FL=1|jgi:hypothetical protein